MDASKEYTKEHTALGKFYYSSHHEWVPCKTNKSQSERRIDQEKKKHNIL